MDIRGEFLLGCGVFLGKAAPYVSAVLSGGLLTLTLEKWPCHDATTLETKKARLINSLKDPGFIYNHNCHSIPSNTSRRFSS